MNLFANVYILGGVRVPAFIHSKLLTNNGTTSMDLMHVTDWLPTLVNLAGGLSSVDVVVVVCIMFIICQ